MAGDAMTSKPDTRKLKKAGAVRGGQKVLNLSGKGTRKPTPVQAYQRLYYNKLKSRINTDYDEYLKTLLPDDKPKAHLTWGNKHCTKLFAKEKDTEVLEAVACEVKESGVAKAERSSSQEQSITENEDELQLSHSLMVALREAKMMYGWSGTVVIGGPRPGKGGQLESFSISTEIVPGMSFGKLYEHFGAHIKTPFVDLIGKHICPDMLTGAPDAAATQGSSPSRGDSPLNDKGGKGDDQAKDVIDDDGEGHIKEDREQVAGEESRGEDGDELTDKPIVQTEGKGADQHESAPTSDGANGKDNAEGLPATKMAVSDSVDVEKTLPIPVMPTAAPPSISPATVPAMTADIIHKVDMTVLPMVGWDTKVAFVRETLAVIEEAIDVLE
ncbi:hypothetical protein OF83DRAFT_1174472 [Amylostereum chailletii]|nr:hypothetical protein OF83DRAFT_1174472 [Amylostereum chailletii]